jgi:hypothetical protein
MIRRAIFLFVQRYLWKKLLRGSFKAKIFAVFSIVGSLVLGGAIFASFYLNMTFIQGAWWSWGHIEDGFGSLIRMF